MLAGDLRHVNTRLESLGDDPDLLSTWPVPTPLRPCDNLDTARRSFIAKVKSIANPRTTMTTPLTDCYVGAEQRLRCSRAATLQ